MEAPKGLQGFVSNQQRHIAARTQQRREAEGPSWLTPWLTTRPTPGKAAAALAGANHTGRSPVRCEAETQLNKHRVTYSQAGHRMVRTRRLSPFLRQVLPPDPRWTNSTNPVTDPVAQQTTYLIMVGISIIRRVLLLASAVLPPGHAQTIAGDDGQLLGEST